MSDQEVAEALRVLRRHEVEAELDKALDVIEESLKNEDFKCFRHYAITDHCWGYECKYRKDLYYLDLNDPDHQCPFMNLYRFYCKYRNKAV